MAAGTVAASDQQMKELLQEVTRLQSLGNLLKTLVEEERNQIKLKDESVKVRLIINLIEFSNPPPGYSLDGESPL